MYEVSLLGMYSTKMKTQIHLDYMYILYVYTIYMILIYTIIYNNNYIYPKLKITQMSINCQLVTKTCCGMFIYRTPLLNIKGQIAYTCSSMDKSKSSC